MIWSHDSLWQKAKLYMDRAYAEDREGSMFPFWASLSLEFLARALLAKVSPTLLADPQKPESLFFALGIGVTSKPKSIDITTVYLRCQVVLPGEFTKEMADACTSLGERRNAELHSGALAFEELHTSIWLAKFYKACDILLRGQDKTLEDFINESEDVVAAREMIRELDQNNIDTARGLIGRAAAAFQKLEKTEKEQKILLASVETKLAEGRNPASKIISCPACKNEALLEGKRVRSTPPELHEDTLHWETIYLPSHFQCYFCQLDLFGYPLIEAAQIGGQFTKEHEEDPLAYYSPAEEYFEEYDNM